MQKRKLILKKESFGGVFVDTQTGRRNFLRHEEYESKRQELLNFKTPNVEVKIVDVTERGYSLIPNATSSPNSIFWELTKRCNGSCTDCFMDSNAKKWSKDEVSFAEIENIARQFSDLGGYSVRLTGGEPTLREDFFDIVDLFNENAMDVGLNTNGMFDKRKLEQIVSRGIKDIRISLDGPEEVNDKIRWSGNYRGAIRTIERLAEYNQTSSNPTKPTINVVLMKSTNPYIEHMTELAQSYNFKISFGLMRLTGRAKTDEMLSPEEVVQAAYRVQKIRDKLGLVKGTVRINYDLFCEGAQDGKGRPISGYLPYPFDNSKCALGSSGLNLDAFARLSSCGYLINADEFVGEDIRGKDLLDVWHNSPLLKKMRNLTRKGCTDCNHYKIKCNGGCPAMAYFQTGDINGEDPYCIRNVDLTNIGKIK